MRGTALAPEVLRARRLVRALVVCDLGAATAVMGTVLAAGPLALLTIGLIFVVPLLVADARSWHMDPNPLRWRLFVGAADSLFPLLLSRWARGRYQWHPLPDGFHTVLLCFALLCCLSLPLFFHARTVARRHPVEHYHPAHPGGGGGAGKAAIAATKAPPTSGFPSCWVGRRRFF